MRERVLKVWRCYLHSFWRYRKKTREGFQGSEYFCQVLYSTGLSRATIDDEELFTKMAIVAKVLVCDCSLLFGCVLWSFLNTDVISTNIWAFLVDKLTRAPLGYFYNAPHWGGGAISSPPPSDLRNYWTDCKNSNSIWKPWKNCRRKTNFIDLGVTSDVTGQVKVKMFDFSGLVTSASKIATLSSNNVNESAWIVSLTFVSIIYCALWP